MRVRSKVRWEVGWGVVIEAYCVRTIRWERGGWCAGNTHRQGIILLRRRYVRVPVITWAILLALLVFPPLLADLSSCTMRGSFFIPTRTIPSTGASHSYSFWIPWPYDSRKSHRNLLRNRARLLVLTARHLSSISCVTPLVGFESAQWSSAMLETNEEG